MGIRIYTYVRAFYGDFETLRPQSVQKYVRIASHKAYESGNASLRYRTAPRCFVFATRTLRDHISGSVALDIAQTKRSGKNVAIREMPVKISEMQ